jgi:hypothetical protein
MTSEIAFATQHTSLWHILAPTSERFVRQINLNLDRYAREIRTIDDPSRRGFLNEVAFQFTRLNSNAAVATIPEASAAARSRLATLEREVHGAVDDPSDIEIGTVSAIQESLLNFVRQRSSSQTLRVTFEPHFSGCGFLNPCVGDVLIGEELYEVKAGDRRFRSTDLRQLMTYCTLNYAAGTCRITKAGCVNPRRGTYFVLELDAIAYAMAGKSSGELFSDIIYHVSSGGVSR